MVKKHPAVLLEDLSREQLREVLVYLQGRRRILDDYFETQRDRRGNNGDIDNGNNWKSNGDGKDRVRVNGKYDFSNVEDAWHKLVLLSMPIAKMVASKYIRLFHMRETVDEIAPEAIDQLPKAIRKYDKEYSPRAYLYKWFSSAIRRYCERINCIIVSPSYHYQARRNEIKINNFSINFFERHDREPTKKEIKKEIKLRAIDLRRLEFFKRNPSPRRVLSLDLAIDDDRTLSDLVPSPDDQYDFGKNELLERARGVMDKTLSEKEKYILLEYYLKGRKLKELGREFGLTKERIRQIKKKSLFKIRALIGYTEQENRRSISWRYRRNGESPLEFYLSHYDGHTRGKLKREDRSLYDYMYSHGLIEHVPTLINRHGHRTSRTRRGDKISHSRVK